MGSVIETKLVRNSGVTNPFPRKYFVGHVCNNHFAISKIKKIRRLENMLLDEYALSLRFVRNEPSIYFVRSIRDG